MKTIFFILIYASAMVCPSFGQETKKYEPGVPNSQGENSELELRGAIYYSEDFDGGWNGWKAEIQDGPVGFEIVSSFNNQYVDALKTSTPTKWVVLDSDGKGKKGQSEKATLTSPSIDLTEPLKNGVHVGLQFDQYFREWTNPVDEKLYVEVSSDSGTTWKGRTISDKVGRFSRPNPERMIVKISNLITGGDSSNVQIRFRWEGSYNYGWQIDNVLVQEMDRYDGELIKAWKENKNYIYNDYAKIPASQERQIDTVSYTIYNRGGESMRNFDVAVSIVGSISGEVATGSVIVDSLSSMKTDTLNIPLDNKLTLTSIEKYTSYVYLVGDSVSGNDSSSIGYEVTQNIFTHYTEPDSFSGNSEITDSSEGERSIGTVFHITKDQKFRRVQVKFGSKMSTEDDYVLFIRKLNNGIQDVSDYAEVEFKLTASDITEQAGWVNIDLEETVLLEEGVYVVEIWSYDCKTSPLSVLAIRHNSWRDKSTVRWGPFGSGGNAINRYWGWKYTPAIRLDFDPTVNVAENQSNVLELSAYPNPSLGNVNVRYQVVDDSDVHCTLHDATGKLVKIWDFEGQKEGLHMLEIDGTQFKNGVYQLSITDGSNTLTEKITILK